MEPDADEIFKKPKLPNVEAEAEVTTDSSVVSSDVKVSPAKPPPVYKKPKWGAPPTNKYWIEILKSGQLIETHELKEENFLVGRAPNSDLVLEHPSVSRYHAVIQFRDNGNAYVYDVGSTHGTMLNKTLIRQRLYFRLRVGDMMKFGQSTRLAVFCSTREEEEKVEKEKQDLVDEMRQQRAQYLKEVTREQTIKKLEEKSEEKAAFLADFHATSSDADVIAIARQGVTWGMDEEDAVNIEDDETTTKEVKSRNEFDSHDEYQTYLKQMRVSDHKKKQVKSEETKKRELEEKRNLGAYYGGSDDEKDGFYDRTKEAENGGKSLISQNAMNYKSLQLEKTNLLIKMVRIRRDVELSKQKEKAGAGGNTQGDSLDSFMNDVSLNLEVEKRAKLEQELVKLEAVSDKLDRMIEICRPALEGLESGSRTVRQSTHVPRKSAKNELIVKPVHVEGMAPDNIVEEESEEDLLVQTTSFQSEPEPNTETLVKELELPLKDDGTKLLPQTSNYHAGLNIVSKVSDEVKEVVIDKVTVEEKEEKKVELVIKPEDKEKKMPEAKPKRQRMTAEDLQRKRAKFEALRTKAERKQVYQPQEEWF